MMRTLLIALLRSMYFWQKCLSLKRLLRPLKKSFFGDGPLLKKSLFGPLFGPLFFVDEGCYELISPDLMKKIKKKAH
jgi:hypothetical protein